jgi:diacylglycerol kinase (ATP)
MRVTLMHNPRAGGGGPSRKKLTRWVEDAGYAVSYQSTRKKKFAEALKEPGDLVIVAGGDGTVTKVARHLVGSGTPMAIVPLGTANNIAGALGIRGKPKQIIAGLESARSMNLDVGLVQAPWGQVRFFEGIGVGLFTEAMCLADAKDAAGNAHGEQERQVFARELRFLRRALIDFRPLTLTVSVDGADVSGEYLLCEVMNISSIGPQLSLAPQADPADGLLDVVLLDEGQREVLHSYLTGRIAGDETHPDLHVRRASHVRISIRGAAVRIDDRIKRVSAGQDSVTADGKPVETTLDVSLEPRALTVLVPARASEQAPGTQQPDPS